MRCTVETDKPEALAIERVLQWVAAAGILSNVVLTTSAIFSSRDLARRPGAGLVGKAVQSFGGEPPAPNRHRQAADPKLPGNRQIGRAIGRQQHDVGAHRLGTRRIFRRRVRAASSRRSASSNSIPTADRHAIPAPAAAAAERTIKWLT